METTTETIEYKACVECLFCIEYGLLGFNGEIVEKSVDKLQDTLYLHDAGDLGFMKSPCDICNCELCGERYLIIGTPLV